MHAIRVRVERLAATVAGSARRVDVGRIINSMSPTAEAGESRPDSEGARASRACADVRGAASAGTRVSGSRTYAQARRAPPLRRCWGGTEPRSCRSSPNRPATSPRCSGPERSRSSPGTRRPLPGISATRAARLPCACRPISWRWSCCATPARWPSAAPTAPGLPPATTCANAQAQLGDAVAVYLDAGPTTAAVPSTIVDVTGAVPVLVRPGGITIERLREIVPEIEDQP